MGICHASGLGFVFKPVSEALGVDCSQAGDIDWAVPMLQLRLNVPLLRVSGHIWVQEGIFPHGQTVVFLPSPVADSLAFNLGSPECKLTTSYRSRTEDPMMSLWQVRVSSCLLRQG